MLHQLNVRQRRGVTVVECAVVYPVTFLFLLGLIVGGLGIFRYQQVAHLARESVRYAAVHGGQYQAETGQTAATEQAVFDHAVSKSNALDKNYLAVQTFLNVTSVDSSGNITVTTVAWDQSNKSPTNLISDNGQARQNTVTVTVSYQWLPEVFLVGPITLSSTATIPMQY